MININGIAVYDGEGMVFVIKMVFVLEMPLSVLTVVQCGIPVIFV